MEATTSNNAFKAQVAARLAELGYDIETFSSEKESHAADYRDGNPSVYCGTYGKYNDGNLSGQWIDLTTFSDYDEFRNYCYALHADEEDPELMFQDYENFPSDYYDECMGEDEFDKIQRYVEMCEKHKQEAVDAYLSLTCGDDLDGFEEAYQGEWDSEEDFAQQLVEDCYCDDFRGMSDLIRNNIDWRGIARDLFSDGYSYEDGFVFYGC